MFTGIIEELGTIRRIGGGQLEIAASLVLEDVKLGDSIAVNGICLTVTSFSHTCFTADVMPETIRQTSLSDLKQGSFVNLERALTLSSRLGGHIVSGHIDGVGKIVSMKQEGNAILLTAAADKEILDGIVARGSVTLDGISLTVVRVTEETFTVSLIPHTREVTNLKAKQAGSLINIETDVIGKYVEKLMTRDERKEEKRAITRTLLLENGFLA